jgi:GxxExxY protein
MSDLLHADITEKIIGAAYYVYNTLGHGFLEKVYENALTIKLAKAGLAVAQQTPITVFFEDEIVGEYFTDLVVEGKVIVEIKAVTNLNKMHEVQLVNYLKATGINVGLLINFGERMKIVRRVF